MEERKFEFYLPRKDFARILRYQRRYYLISEFFLLSFLIADGILLGVFITSSVKWLFFSLIPFLAVVYGLVWFLAIRDGGMPIYGQCTLIFDGDRTLTLKCQREPSPFYPCQTCFSKTMKVKKWNEKGKYYVVYDDRKQWALIPTSIPIKEILNFDSDSK